MPALSLRYDHCSLRKPRYLNKLAIETVAREARAQLLPPGADALTLEQLAAISDLTINGQPTQELSLQERPKVQRLSSCSTTARRSRTVCRTTATC